jgi:hypothetical protein
MLKTIYDSAEDIPEGYADLYTERNGKWELTGIQGVKTQADVERVQEALRKEKADHRLAKTALQAFEGIDPEAITAQANKLEEVTAQLEAINKDGRVDEAKLEPIIAARIKQAVAPLERDKVNLERQLDAQKKIVGEKDGEVITLRTSITTGDIERQIRDAAAEAKVAPLAIFDAIRYGREVFEKAEDGRVITKDVNGVVPGLTPKEWFKDQLDKSPHWWPVSVGGGSQGSGNSGRGGYGGVNNPWSRAGWNVTKQGTLVKTLGEPKASEIAAQVGAKIGDTKPAQAAA